MLWTLVDVLAVILALGIVAVAMPGRAARAWRRGLLERSKELDQSKASPSRDSSSTT